MISIEKILDKLIKKTPKYDLLWTNPNPTSTFAGQTIQLDLSNYTELSIEYRNGTASDGASIFSMHAVGKNGYVCMSWAGGTGSRDISCTDSKITFGDGHSANHGASSWRTDNGQFIPVKIYGIKLGGGVFNRITSLINTFSLSLEGSVL